MVEGVPGFKEGRRTSLRSEGASHADVCGKRGRPSQNPQGGCVPGGLEKQQEASVAEAQ